jgi:hypothetical protein
VALGNGNFALMANYTYAEDGNFTLSVQISDVGGASASGSQGVTVADARLFNLSVSNPHATEGHSTGTFTVASFADTNIPAPTSDFTAVVNWGDGHTSTITGAGIVLGGGSGTFAVLASHTYASTGTFTLSVQVLDEGGASVTGNLTISVAP